MISRTLSLVCALAWGTALPALADDSLEAQVDSYLGGLDQPVAAEHWKGLGPNAVPILERHALDPKELPSIRARAVEALGLVGTVVHGEKLLQVSADPSAPLLVRTTALRSAGKLVSQERVETAIAPLLSADPSPRIRGAAADVMAERLGASACARIRKQAKGESANPHPFAPALKKCLTAK